MQDQLSRRRFLMTAAALPALSALLAACGEDSRQSEKAPQSGSETKKAEAPRPVGTVDMKALLEPGSLPEKYLGKEDAKLTIVEYASMTCPHCANFHATTLPELKKRYIDTGKVRLILREFPFDPRAEAGFMLARCAGDNYFPMIDVLFRQQQQWAAAENGREAMLKIAKLAGFTQEKFEACLTDQKLLDDVKAVRDRGQREFGVESTPTFFIDGGRYPGAMSIEDFAAIIDPLVA